MRFIVRVQVQPLKYAYLCVYGVPRYTDSKYLGTEILEQIQTNRNRMCTRRPLRRRIMSDRSTKLYAKRQV